MHSLQMYTDGPEMNFRTESLDFPQNEQRRCLSCDMTAHSTRVMRTPKPLIQRLSAGEIRPEGKGTGKELKAPHRPSKRRPKVVKVFHNPGSRCGRQTAGA